MKNNILKKAILFTSISGSLLANTISVDQVGIHLGWQNTKHSQKNTEGLVTLSNKPDSHFKALEIFTTLNGVFDRDDLKPYFSYTHSFLNDEIGHKYILGGVNKYFKYNNDLTLYAGVFGGYGILDWNYNPITNTTEEKNSITSFNMGLQGGLEYPLQDKLSLVLNTKYIKHNYETIIQPNTSNKATISQKSTNFLGLGILYSFNTTSKQVQNKPKPISKKVEPPKQVIKKQTLIDSDKDGIIDSIDRCQKTPIGSIVTKDGCKINLELTINYPENSTSIDLQYFQKINEIVQFLKAYPEYNVIIDAHTDNEGSIPDNFKLSEQRAEILQDRLIKNDIQSNRIKYYAHGETNPIASNDTDKGMQLNRRLEITFYKNK